MLKQKDTVKFLSDLTVQSKGQVNGLAASFWNAFSTPIRGYMKPMATFYNTWTTATEKGVPQKPGDILGSTIERINLQIGHLTNKINELIANINNAAGGNTNSSSGPAQATSNCFRSRCYSSKYER